MCCHRIYFFIDIKKKEKRLKTKVICICIRMEDQHNEFISEAVDILVDLLKGKDYETIRRINYLVNIAKQDELKKSLNRMKSMSIEELSDFADMVTRVFKDDKEFLENELTRLEEIFITKRINDRHGKMQRFISVCNCA